MSATATDGARRPRHRRWWFRPAAAAVVAVLVALIAVVGLQTRQLFQYRELTRDFLFPTGTADERVVVVGLDARSLRELGIAWPWPRDVHARLIDELTARGAAAIGYDVVFDLPGTGDDDLASALASSGNVVLGVAPDTVVPVSGDLLGAAALSEPMEEFAAGAAALGHVNVHPDPSDGVVRWVPLVIEAPDRSLLPALSLATVAVATGENPDVVTLRPDGVQVGDRLHPTEELRNLRVNFSEGLERPRAAGDAFLSAIDVLRGDVDRDLEGAIVFVGTTDPLLGDNKPIPVAKAGAGGPGVFVHANAASTILTSRYLMPVSDATTVVAILVLAFLVALVVLSTPIWAAPLVALAGGVGFLFYAAARFDAGHAWDLLYPLVGIVIAATGAVAVRYVTETRERRLVAGLFSQYVPDVIAQQLVDEGRVRSAAEGERVEVTVFFCDLRGFTAMAAVRSPAEVRDMLSIYYEYGTRTVLEHGGTLMQYVGDEIFAVFGAPVRQPDHADRALACAIAFQRAAADIEADLAAAGLPPLRYGIGLNSGEVVAAHMGGALRRQYGVIGDTVNVGARLCSLAAPGEITTSKGMRSRLSWTPEIDPLGPVELKGVSEDPEVARVVLDAAAADAPRIVTSHDGPSE
ncbi:MAG: CHASE2 domain-containing protein [Nitriliruptorales bacterium]